MAVPLDDNRARVFFSSRDSTQRSHIVSVTVALSADGELEVVQPPGSQPVLAPGPLGCFDDHGVFPASLTEAADGRLFLYYVGWNPGPRPPLFYATIGLAISDDEGATFRRRGPAPVMARSDHDPCLVTSPCVRVEDGLFRMWYVSGFRWEERKDQLVSYYHVKYAHSRDGIEWRREGHICIDLTPGETNIARPCVLLDADGYRMWYSHNAGSGYRLGYAESADGLNWTRLDERAGILPSDDGWDAGAQAYPWVVRLAGREVLLYNGNGYGREGFGAAVSTTSVHS